MNDHKLTGSGQNMVSVIVPFYNRSETVSSLVRDLLLVQNAELEIILVNDCSTEDLSSLRETNVRMIDLPLRCGPSYAKNMGALHAAGEWLLFLDSDVRLPSADFIAEMIRFARTTALPLGVLGGEYEVRDGRALINGGRVSWRGQMLKTAMPVSDARGVRCDCVPSSNCFVPREVFFSAGGFDPFYVYPGEDKDLCRRLQKRKRFNFYDIKCTVEHLYSSSFRNHGCFDYYRSNVRFCCKHRPAVLWPLIMAADILHVARQELSVLKAVLCGKSETSHRKAIHSRARGFFPFLRCYIRAWALNLRAAAKGEMKEDDYFLPETRDRFLSFIEKSTKAKSEAVGVQA